MDTAHSLGVPIPLPARFLEILQALKVDGKGKNDHSGIVQFYEGLANVPSAALRIAGVDSEYP